MFELSLLIPVADNAGEIFTDADHGVFEAFVVERFGGLTLFPSTATGVWTDAGTTYRDRTRIYAVAVRSLVDGGKVGEVVAFAKRHYRQEAIFVRYLGLSEIL